MMYPASAAIPDSEMHRIEIPPEQRRICAAAREFVEVEAESPGLQSRVLLECPINTGNSVAHFGVGKVSKRLRDVSVAGRMGIRTSQLLSVLLRTFQTSPLDRRNLLRADLRLG